MVLLHLRPVYDAHLQAAVNHCLQIRTCDHRHTGIRDNRDEEGDAAGRRIESAARWAAQNEAEVVITGCGASTGPLCHRGLSVAIIICPVH